MHHDPWLGVIPKLIMIEKRSDLIQSAINGLLRAPNVRAVHICDAKGAMVAMGGGENKVDQELLQAMASSVFPATKRMAEKSGNTNEAQSISLPGDDLHLLIFWLAFDDFLLVSFSKPANPYAPPKSILAACNLLRYILQPSGQQNEQAISSAGIEMETAIYVERLISSKIIIKDTGIEPNLYDLSYVEAQSKKIMEVARDILSSRKGVIEGARLLVQLQPTVTRDEFDPDFLPFIVIASETENLPVGKERQYWADDVLREKDKEIQQEEELYRDKAFSACQALLARFDNK